jgi:hypothetical protein
LQQSLAAEVDVRFQDALRQAMKTDGSRLVPARPVRSELGFVWRDGRLCRRCVAADVPVTIDDAIALAEQDSEQAWEVLPSPRARQRLASSES